MTSIPRQYEDLAADFSNEQTEFIAWDFHEGTDMISGYCGVEKHVGLEDESNILYVTVDSAGASEIFGTLAEAREEAVEFALHLASCNDSSYDGASDARIPARFIDENSQGRLS